MTSQNVDPSVSRASKEMSSSSSIAMDGHAVTKRLQQDLMTLMVIYCSYHFSVVYDEMLLALVDILLFKLGLR